MEGNLAFIIWVEIGSLKILIYQKINIKDLFYKILCLLQIYNSQKFINFTINVSRCDMAAVIGIRTEKGSTQGSVELFWFDKMTWIYSLKSEESVRKYILLLKSLLFKLSSSGST